MEIVINITPELLKESLTEAVAEGEQLCSLLMDQLKSLGYNAKLDLEIRREK